MAFTLEQLLALADLPDEAEARRQLAPLLADAKPFDGRPWQEAPVASVVALLLMQAGRVTEPMEVLVHHLRSRGVHPTAVQLLDIGRRQIYNNAMQSLHQRRPDLARGLLALQHRLLGSIADLTVEQSLGEMIDFVEAARSQRDQPIPAEGRPTVIHLGVWGERFMKVAERAILPCLLAPGNVPALAAYGTVVVFIHTQAADIDAFRRLPVIEALSRHARIEFSAIPQKLLAGTHLSGKAPWLRAIICALQYDALMFARRLGADFVPMGADALLSGKCLSTAKGIIVAGKEAVAVGPVRSVADRMLALLDERGFRAGPCLDVPAEALYRASLETLHPFIKESFFTEPAKRLAVDPVQFYFPIVRGFSSRCFHQLPLMFSTRRLPADHICDYHTLDTRLLSDVLAGLDRDVACHVHDRLPGDMYYIALDEAEGVAAFGSFEFSPAGAAEAIEKWMLRYEDIDHFMWAIRQRFEYAMPEGVEFHVPPDCIDENKAVLETVERIRARRLAIIENLNRYRPGGMARTTG